MATMETITFKARRGTKAKLGALAERANTDMSEMLRTETDKLIARRVESAYDRTAHLCGAVEGRTAKASTSKDYLKQYAPKRAR